MAKGKAGVERGSSNHETSKKVSEKPRARSLGIAKQGITNSHNFKSFMSALMSDLIEGTVAPSIGNAACNAGGKLQRMVELEYKYGSSGINGEPKVLHLTIEQPSQLDTKAPVKTLTA